MNGRRGLYRAVVEGMLATSAPYTAVIDADLQHDETLLPKMLTRLREVDIVIGGRYTAGGSVGGWDSSRAAMSPLCDGDFAGHRTLVAMTSNYWLYNFLTYRDRPRRGFKFLHWPAVVSCGLQYRRRR